MKVYYKARNHQGKSIYGDIEANSIEDARQQLSREKMIITNLTSKPNDHFFQNSVEAARKTFQHLDIEELLLFTQQLQAVNSVGMSISQGLVLIRDQSSHVGLCKSIDSMIYDINEGNSLASAMRKHPQFFDSTYVNLIEVGEKTGSLDEVLERLFHLIERQADNKRKIKGALFYPKMALTLSFIVFLGMTQFIIPKLKLFYDKMGGKLPAITRLLMSISEVMTSYWYIVFPLLAVSFFGIYQYFQTNSGKKLFDKVILSSPIFGKLIIDMEMNTFSAILNILTRSGLDIVSAFKAMHQNLSNTFVKQDIEVATESIKKGTSIYKSLEDSKYFSKITKNLIRVGEETGKLDLATEKLAKYYQAQIDYKVSNLSKVLEPVMLVIVFSIVIVLALALFLPMWQLSSLIKR